MVAKENIQDIYSLSPLQEGFLFHNVSGASAGTYFIQTSYKLTGVLDEDMMRQSLELLMKQFDILRNAFVFEGLKKILQVTLKERMPDFSVIDLREVPDQQSQINAFRHKDKVRGFDLAKDVLIRLTLIRTGDEAYILVWSHHHILMDGWCTGILIKEFIKIYVSLSAGRVYKPGTIVQYREYIRWLEKQDKAAARNYWKTYLGDFNGAGSSLQVLKVAAGTAYDNREIVLDPGPALSAAIRQAAINANVTLNSFLQAAWGVLLAGYTGEKDVVFGNVRSVRPAEIPGIEMMVGLCINTLPVRVNLDNAVSFIDLTRSVQQEAANGDRYGYAPLAEIQADTNIKQHLVDHVFVLGNYPEAPGKDPAYEEEPGGLAVEINSSESFAQVNYDFSVHITAGQSIVFRFNYNANAYDTDYVKGISRNYHHILEQVSQHTAVAVHDIFLPDVAEEQEILKLGKGYNGYYEGTIDSVFLENAAKYPDHIGLQAFGQSYTYHRLAQSSKALYQLLLDRGVSKGDRVGVMTGRSMEMVVSLLAISMAGAVYVPLDPDHPADRLRNLYADAAFPVLLTTSAYFFSLDFFAGTVIAVDVEINEALGTDIVKGRSEPGDEAYIIYTSGTSGEPKGVPVRQESIISRTLYHNEFLGVDHQSVIMQFAAVAFDAAILEILMGLLSGGKVVLVPAFVKQDVPAFGNWLQEQGVTVGIFPPAYLKMLDRHPMESLRTLISTGESAIVEDMIYYSQSRHVYNGYGPTETCIGATFHKIDPARADQYRLLKQIPVGRPFADTQVLLLDKGGRLLPVGVIGEICIAGIGLSKGYNGQPALTAAKFVTYQDQAGSSLRVYRTGDLGRWDKEGELAYMGRIDEQVQIRGIRVEPAEIAHVLLSFEGVKEAAVHFWNQDDQQLLAAYITIKPHTTVDITALRLFAASVLPTYMVPAVIITLDQLPLTANGKVDKNKLPAPDPDHHSRHIYIAPQSETEWALARIWSLVLNKELIGRNEDFFEIGGHSLKATQVVSYIIREMNVRIDIRHLFDYPTIALLAPVVEAASYEKYTPIAPVKEAAHYPATPSQERLWVLDQYGEGNLAYLISGVFRLNGHLDKQSLINAFSQVIQRYEIFRTTFQLIDKDLRQVVHSYTTQWLDFEEYIMAQKSEADLLYWLSTQKKQPFDLANGPLFRIRLVKMDTDEWVLSCVMHHIISDGWSIQLLIKEVTALYADAVNGLDRHHPVPAVQYKDYAVWLEEELRNGALVKSGEYWKKQLGEPLPVLELPLDFSRPALQTFNGESFPFILEKDKLDKLRAIAVKEGLSVFMLLLSSVKLLLHYCSQQNEVVVGTVVAGRQHFNLKDQQGCFVNTLVLRSAFSETATLKDYLQQVKQVVLLAYENQDYPFDKLLEEIVVERDLSRSALFDVLVSHQVIDPVGSQFTMEGLTVKKYESTSNATASKVDLEFEFFEHENVLAGQLIYNTALFLPSTAARFVSYFHTLINALIADRDTLLKDVRLTTAAEEALLIEKGAGRKTNYPVHLHFIELLKKKVEENPAAIALVEGELKWSYATLHEWSDKLAARLQNEYAILHEEPVGVYMQRGLYLIGSIIAIWKAGGAYLPLEPSLPADRLSFMMDNADLRIVLQDELHPLPVSCAVTVSVNQVTDIVSDPFTAAYTLTANDLAYIIYTSGSTGMPKGAMINQAGMLNHMYAKIDDFKLHHGSRVAQTASQSFDISIWQMLAALLAGGQVHIYSHQELLDVNKFLPQIVKDGITVLQIVPSYLSEIVQPTFVGLLTADHSLEYIISTGEELKYTLVENWFDLYPSIKLVNAYGPTEAADDITHAIFDAPVRKGKVPLGYTLPNLRIYIVDKDGRLVPDGLLGEIWVSGIGVGSGYVKLPDKTAAAFIDDPFYAGNRVYRTGDLGRWNAEGVLEYFGRNDKQIKIRGHRVEPGETEQVIMEYPTIKLAVAVPKMLRGEQLLVAYIVWKQTGDKDVLQLKEWIRQKLPDYMLPSVIIEMESIALNINGKIDYKQLPEPSPLAISELHIEPRDETESIIRDIWQEILGKENISMNDNFFDLGGHSLKGIRLVARIREQLLVNITLKDIFQSPTPAAQARIVSAVKWVNREPASLSSLADDNVENILI